MSGAEVGLSGLKSLPHHLTVVIGKPFNISRSPYLHLEKEIIIAPTPHRVNVWVKSIQCTKQSAWHVGDGQTYRPWALCSYYYYHHVTS